MGDKISVLQGAILGFVEGLTEYLPVSSTGHLVLTSQKLDLTKGEGLDAFEVIIQAGALLAVLGLYRRSVWAMLQGLAGRNREGLRLFLLLSIAFLPMGIMGFILGHRVQERLFYPVPVALALAVGGIAMILLQRWTRRKYVEPLMASSGSAGASYLHVMDITATQALIIGLAQCLALWPGTSRSMVTILAGILLGFTPLVAAEFSFLLALPVLGAATTYEILKHGHQILASADRGAVVAGLIVSFIVAAVTVQFFIRYLTRHGLAAFGYYRIVLAMLVFLLWKA